jgi:hypothetical protein
LCRMRWSERFAPLNAGDATARMACIPFVARPSLGEGYAKSPALAHNVGLAPEQETIREADTAANGAASHRDHRKAVFTVPIG